MQEVNGDIFDYLADTTTDAICIFTNGIVNKHGDAMAGAGQAGAASDLWCNFRYNLGCHIKEHGNTAGIVGKTSHNPIRSLMKPYWYSSIMSLSGIFIISFPTKQHFNNPAIPALIKQSAQKLVEISNSLNFKKVVMGRPGCGIKTGQLNWEKDVKPLVFPLLDDRFIIVNKPYVESTYA